MYTQRLRARVDADSTLIIPGKLGHIYQYDDHSLAVIVMPFLFPTNPLLDFHSEDVGEA